MTRLGSRQMLPYRYDDLAQPLPTVDAGSIGGPGQNHSGMYGSAAVHYGYHYLFAGLGRWHGDCPHTGDVDDDDFP